MDLKLSALPISSQSAVQESRTKARSATHSPEEVLKKQVDELTARAQLLEHEKSAADESRNYVQLERVSPTSLLSDTPVICIYSDL